ncbi:MAG TPA: sulfotransferase [Thermomonas sp.]|nr:sulfotransferase [Thermomonas sp.]
MTPEQLEALWRSGQQQQAQGLLDEARDTYAGILAGSPRQLMVRIALSQLEQRAGRYRAARTHALQAADTVAQTNRWEGLSHVTANLLVFDEREQVLQLIRQSGWNDARVLRQSPVLSQQLWLCGDQEGALRLLDIADTRIKDDHRLAYSRAMALQHLGRIQLATAAFEDSIRIAPDFALAHWSLAYHARSQPAEARLPRLRAAARRVQSQQERAMLHYALYKELDAAGDYDAAWPELEAGASLMHRMLGDSGRNFGSDVAAMLDAVGHAPTPIAPVADGARTPVFVVGMPRTGTTLLTRILGAHPHVADAGELNALEHAIAENIDRFVQVPLGRDVLPLLHAADPAGIARAYARRTQAHHLATTTHLIDKNPMNLFAAGAIARTMPNARIICLVRGPMDACYSNFRQLFQNGAFAYSYDFGQLAGRYAVFRRVVDGLAERLPRNFLAVSYEDLVRDPGGTGRRAMEFCGLTFDPAYADTTRNRAPSATASATQIREPIHTHGIGEWRRYEARLQPLAARLAESGIAP